MSAAGGAERFGDEGGTTSAPALGPELEVRRLGRVGYREARALQEELLTERIAGRVPDQLLLVEHPPVVTLGRRTPAAEWGHLGVEVVEVERGGEATWHGPGQLVGYPVVALPEGRRDLHRYLRDLEQVVIQILTGLGLEAGRREGWTGVWVGEQKLCSIGVAVRRWVAWHGFALNVSCDLAGFRGFAPCGLQSAVMGRVADLARIPAEDPLLLEAAEAAFRSVFGYPRP
ncbi:MAG: lipoyl(octanoyl) transferase LipB [Planctomycetota bacterium]